MSAGAHQQLSDMLLRGLSQREDPQHRDLSPHRLGEDHPDRACPLLHRQDSGDSRGERWDPLPVCINRAAAVRWGLTGVQFSLTSLFSSPAGEGEGRCWSHYGLHGAGEAERHHHPVSCYIHSVEEPQHQHHWHTRYWKVFLIWGTQFCTGPLLTPK